ncbi:hypothetical protein, partial [Noviherbaspirillum galbum]
TRISCALDLRHARPAATAETARAAQEAKNARKGTATPAKVAAPEIKKATASESFKDLRRAASAGRAPGRIAMTAAFSKSAQPKRTWKIFSVNIALPFDEMNVEFK